MKLTERLMGWYLPAKLFIQDNLWPVGFWAVLMLNGFLRFFNLGFFQDGFLFDESPYVPHAWYLWNVGYELNFNPGSNKYEFNITEALKFGPELAAHPPLGKWLIGFGMWLFHDPLNVAGWRIMPALFGTILVALTMIIAHKITKKPAVAIVAGLLYGIDGQALIMSRIGMLDIFMAVFLAFGFLFILIDRERFTPTLHKLLKKEERTVLWRRPWLWAAGLMFGLATGVKMAGGFFFFGFAVYILVTEFLARRRAGEEQRIRKTLLQMLKIAAVTIPLYIFTYIACWTGWLVTSGGYDRQWAAENLPKGHFSLFDPLISLGRLHLDLWAFHNSLTQRNILTSMAETWLWMDHPPIAAWKMTNSTQQWGAAQFLGGNIAIWWAAFAAILFLVYRIFRYRDKVATTIVVPVLVMWLPWFLFPSRAMYLFYTVPFQPYLEIGLALGLWYLYQWFRERFSARVASIPFVLYGVLVVGMTAILWPFWNCMFTPAAYFNKVLWLASFSTHITPNDGTFDTGSN